MGRLGVICLAVLLAACSSSSKPPHSSSISVHGQLKLTDTSGDGLDVEGIGCQGSGGYSDIAQGAQVDVTDDAGKTVALASLSGGSADTAGDTCTFSFTATVPAGSSFYGLAVTHRGVVKFTAAELAGGPVLTLGS